MQSWEIEFKKVNDPSNTFHSKKMTQTRVDLVIASSSAHASPMLGHIPLALMEKFLRTSFHKKWWTRLS